MIGHRIVRRCGLTACLVGVLAGPVAAQAPATEYEGAAALGLALRKLGTTKRVLMIGAHPDDESTQILGTLALGQGADVAYLSLTRGEGGQNGIGPELQEGLGLLRSEELLAARRLDGARQYFTRAYDYGFSKDAAEAFRHWPRDSVLADVVAVVRHFRPDVILAIFSGTPRDGHGQHEASGILAREAFAAAADPARFPDQVRRGLAPHAAAKLYQALWWRDEGATERLATGALDPLLGRSHYQVAMESRSRHRSQDMGRPHTPGPQSSALRLIESRVGTSGELFAGIDTTLAQQARAQAQTENGGAGGDRDVARLLAAYGERVGAARERYNALRPGAMVPELGAALRLLDAARERLPRAAGDSTFLAEIAAERRELEDALLLALGVRLDAIASDEMLVPGQEFELTTTLWNGGTRVLALEELAPRAAAGWRVQPLDSLPRALAPGTLLTRRFRVTVPTDATPTEPYYLRLPRNGDLYRWPGEVGGVGVPFEPPILRAAAAIGVDGSRLHAERAATFQGVDKMVGEFRRPLRVVPAVALTLEPALAVVPPGAAAAEAQRFAVRVRSEAPGGISGVLRAHVPAGWRVEPRQVPLEFGEEGEERVLQLELTPPATLAPGEFALRTVFEAQNGERYARGFTLVDYPHIHPRPLYRPAEAALRAFDLRLPEGLRVGYVAGPGDEVQAALSQLGLRVEPLGPEALAHGDLARYDVIVTGIRAYEVRPDLVRHNARLLDYVRRGGTLVVQYNKYEYTEPGIAPYPVEMSRPHDRVTDETAPVRLLAPEHPIFTRPNRITPADFDGWVQERGLYFLSRWDGAFTPLLEMADPGEAPLRGSLLIARYGEGTYVYTGLAFFRQLPAGVPGAYRLFANLLALGGAP